MMNSTIRTDKSSIKFVLVTLFTGITMILSNSANAQLTVNENATIAQMTSAIQGSGVVVSNMVITSGTNAQVSGFTNISQTGNPLSIPSGILLATGRGNTAVGPNNSSNQSTNNNITLNDPDLLMLGPLANRDVVIVEFDVSPKTDTMQLEFQWGSEEYLEYTCSNYNDVFAFLVSGPGISGPYQNSAANFAQLPDGTPVSIGTVNQGAPGQFGNAANCASFANTAFFQNNTGNTFIQADGITTKLKVKGIVEPCATYHVKCVLADAGDNVYDSWVWLDGFTALGQAVSIAPAITGQQMIEGCNSVTFRASRTGDISVPLGVALTYGGTAINGVDYFGGPSLISFASGSTETFFTLTAVPDGITEGTETLDINASWTICGTVFSAVFANSIVDRTVNITCPATVTSNSTAGTCAANVTYPLPTAFDNCGPCPAPTSIPGYTFLGVYDNHSYFLSNSNVTWPNAHSAAVNQGGHLATITSAAEQAWLMSVTSSAAWIGLTDEANEGNFLWVTGEPFVYNNWCSFQPNNLGNEDYVDFRNQASGCWGDRGAAVTNPFIVEFDCSMSQISGPASGSSFPVGTTPVTFQATNGYSTSQCTFNVVVLDTEAPTISCPAAQTLNLVASCSAPLGDYRSLATVNDNCGAGGVTITQSPAAGTSVSGLGVTVVTLTATDAAGNSTSCTFNVNKVDTTVPTITCPANITQNVSASSCNRNVNTPNPTTSDNCSVSQLTWTLTGATVASSPVTGINNVGNRSFNAGITTVTYTVTDASGNTASCSYTVTILENVLPTITCPPNQTAVVAPGTCAALVTTPNPVTADNCGVGTLTWTMTGATVASSPATGINNVGTYSFNAGTTTVSYVVRDNVLNPAFCSFTVTVTDNINPTITCPANITATAGAGTCNASVVTPNPTASDNCAITRLTWSLTGATGGSSPGTGINYLGTYTFNVGTTTVTYNTRDAANNTATCSFTVIVTDNIAPTVTCPANITQNTLAGTCNRSVITPNPTTSDNCAVTRLTWVMSGATTGSSPATGINNLGTQTFNNGITNVTYTVYDAAGNTNTCSFTVTITDNTPPTITCPAAQTLVLNATCAGVLADYRSLATVADNCTATGSLVVTQSPAAGTAVSGVGTTVVTLTVTDASGNSANCMFNVNRVDTTPPALTCPGNQTVPSTGTCQGIIGNYIALATATDNCTSTGAITITQSPVAGTAINSATTVTISATDANGNTDVLENIAQLGDVCFFDRVQRFVDALAISRLMTALMQRVEVGAIRKNEALVLQHFKDQFPLVAILRLVALIVILPHIADVFQEEHRENEILVDRRIDRASERVARFPDRLVDVFLFELRGHHCVPFVCVARRDAIASSWASVASMSC